LSKNPNAVSIFERHPDEIDWYWMSYHPTAIHLLEKNWENADLFSLSYNPNAMELLEKHINELNWFWLSHSPVAISILEKNLDKLVWSQLSVNPNAIHLLARLNTKKMRDNCKPFAEELAAYVFHPSRLERICKLYNMELDEYFELV